MADAIPTYPAPTESILDRAQKLKAIWYSNLAQERDNQTAVLAMDFNGDKTRLKLFLRDGQEFEIFTIAKPDNGLVFFIDAFLKCWACGLEEARSKNLSIAGIAISMPGKFVRESDIEMAGNFSCVNAAPVIGALGFNPYQHFADTKQGAFPFKKNCIVAAGSAPTLHKTGDASFNGFNLRTIKENLLPEMPFVVVPGGVAINSALFNKIDVSGGRINSLTAHSLGKEKNIIALRPGRNVATAFIRPGADGRREVLDINISRMVVTEQEFDDLSILRKLAKYSGSKDVHRMTLGNMFSKIALEHIINCEAPVIPSEFDNSSTGTNYAKSVHIALPQVDEVFFSEVKYHHPAHKAHVLGALKILGQYLGHVTSEIKQGRIEHINGEYHMDWLPGEIELLQGVESLLICGEVRNYTFVQGMLGVAQKYIKGEVVFPVLNHWEMPQSDLTVHLARQIFEGHLHEREAHTLLRFNKSVSGPAQGAD